MYDTQCHIHFPDVNRNSLMEKSNQVSISGHVENVERARQRIRDMLPISFTFPLPRSTTPAEVNAYRSSQMRLQLEQRFGIDLCYRQAICSSSPGGIPGNTNLSSSHRIRSIGREGILSQNGWTGAANNGFGPSPGCSENEPEVSCPTEPVVRGDNVLRGVLSPSLAGAHLTLTQSSQKAVLDPFFEYAPSQMMSGPVSPSSVTLPTATVKGLVATARRTKEAVTYLLDYHYGAYAALH
ncbi:unnamed protein product [Protopolystoma xenopodis]|uniref:K Homology domain-containing protein n=1 Tax=Protopolystoma xenopodis TaxID=117903 RepID=A0A448WDN8_9PLAT|nr:unnamed protein product [Protopolystoma xenopodis]